MMKVASVINNYTHYAEEHMSKAFLKLIFPKIYGIPADEMIDQDLVDDEKFLDSSVGLIDAINTYGANRGKYKKGSNKNPITGTGGRTKKEPEENSEEWPEEKQDKEPVAKLKEVSKEDQPKKPEKVEKSDKEKTKKESDNDESEEEKK